MPRGRPVKYEELHNEALLREEYLGERSSINELARRFGCSRYTVVNALDKYGLRDERLEA